MKLTMRPNGTVFLDQFEIGSCVGLDVKNIGPANRVDVLLHIQVDKLDIEYAPTE